CRSLLYFPVMLSNDEISLQELDRLTHEAFGFPAITVQMPKPAQSVEIVSFDEPVRRKRYRQLSMGNALREQVTGGIHLNGLHPGKFVVRLGRAGIQLNCFPEVLDCI